MSAFSNLFCLSLFSCTLICTFLTKKKSLFNPSCSKCGKIFSSIFDRSPSVPLHADPSLLVPSVSDIPASYLTLSSSLETSFCCSFIISPWSGLHFTWPISVYPKCDSEGSSQTEQNVADIKRLRQEVTWIRHHLETEDESTNDSTELVPPIPSLDPAIARPSTVLVPISASSVIMLMPIILMGAEWRLGLSLHNPEAQIAPHQLKLSWPAPDPYYITTQPVSTWPANLMTRFA